jgi:hypothetical protein
MSGFIKYMFRGLLICYIFKKNYEIYIYVYMCYIYCVIKCHYISDSLDMYVVGSRSFRPDIQKARQMENSVRDI